MPSNFTVSANNQSLNVTISVRLENDNVFLDYELELKNSKQESSKGKFSIVLSNEPNVQPMLTGVTELVDKLHCVTLCGLGTLAEPIIDCWGKRGKDLKECVESKLNNLGKSFIKCAISCLLQS